MKNRWSANALLLAGMLAGFHAPAAFADAIKSVTGDLSVVPQPAELNYNGTEFSGVTNPQPIIFNEYTNHVVPTFSAMDPSILAKFGVTPSDFNGLDYLPLDITSPGIYPPEATVNGRVDSGTRVSTYIINFEPSDTNPVGTASGSVTFNKRVLGIEVLESSFSLIREQLFDLPNISLHGSTGLELCTDNSICDTIALSPDMQTVQFALQVNGATDDMRIFLATVPEPNSVSDLGISVLFMWIAYRLQALTRRISAPTASATIAGCSRGRRQGPLLDWNQRRDS